MYGAICLLAKWQWWKKAFGFCSILTWLVGELHMCFLLSDGTDACQAWVHRPDASQPKLRYRQDVYCKYFSSFCRINNEVCRLWYEIYMLILLGQSEIQASSTGSHCLMFGPRRSCLCRHYAVFPCPESAWGGVGGGGTDSLPVHYNFSDLDIILRSQ